MIVAHDVQVYIFFQCLFYISLFSNFVPLILDRVENPTPMIYIDTRNCHRILIFFQCPHNLFCCCCRPRRPSYIYIPTSYVNLKSVFVEIRQNRRNENLNKSLCPVHVKLDTFVDLCGIYIKNIKISS